MIRNNCGCSDYYDAMWRKKCCAELLAVPSKKRMNFMVPCGSCCYQLLKLPMITKCLTQLYNIYDDSFLIIKVNCNAPEKTEKTRMECQNDHQRLIMKQRLKKSWQRFTSSGLVMLVKKEEKNLLFTNNCQRRCLCTIDLSFEKWLSLMLLLDFRKKILLKKSFFGYRRRLRLFLR